MCKASTLLSLSNLKRGLEQRSLFLEPFNSGASAGLSFWGWHNPSPSCCCSSPGLSLSLQLFHPHLNLLNFMAKSRKKNNKRRTIGIILRLFQPIASSVPKAEC